MHFLEIVLVLMLNTGLILIMQRFQNRDLDRKIKVLKNEVQELEDLVTAIIEEFEEVAGTSESKETLDIETANSPRDASPGTVETESLKQPAAEVDHMNVETETNINTETETRRENETGSGTADSRHQRILDLSRDGLSIEEIAKELGIGQGEVSLILGLYRRS